MHKKTSRFIALSLAFLIAVYTVPVSAADINLRASIGSVSAVGSVDLRGVRISSEGTLFSGDRLNVGTGSYARLALETGPKVEVGAGSDVTVSREGESVTVEMKSGNVSFRGNGSSAIRIRVGPHEVTAKGDAAGNVAFVGTETFGVRVSQGSASVRNVQTKQSFTVQQGSERLIGLRTGTSSQSLAQMASAVPGAVPAVPRQQTTGLSKGGWIAVIGTVAGAAAAIIILTTRDDDSDDDATTRLAQVKAVNNLTALTTSSTATQTLATSVNTTNTSARVAITASTVTNKAALQAQADAITNQANSALAKITALTPKINALRDTITNQPGGPTQAQLTELNQLIADLNSARTDANNALTALNALLALALSSGVPGLPAAPNLQPVPPPVIASASAPA